MSATASSEKKKRISPPATTGRSKLAENHSYATDDELTFLFDLMNAEPVSTTRTEDHEDHDVEYLQMSSSNNPFVTDKIIERCCYQHLDPHVDHEVLKGSGKCRVAITGTAGIGKTVYGALLVRRYVRNGKSVLYWEGDNIFLFSTDVRVQERFGLVQLGEGEEGVHYGYWKHSEVASMSGFRELYAQPNVIIIHDPKVGFVDLAHEFTAINTIVYILSYGHSLIDFWKDKGRFPDPAFYLPTWTQEEGTMCAKLLDVAGDGDDLFHNFGGCFRAWLNPEMLEGFESKAKATVKNGGDDILRRTQDFRGSIVHMRVDFDPNKPIRPGFNAPQLEEAATTIGEPNSFRKYEFVFGSQKIIEFVDQALLQGGDEALRLCMSTWGCQSGFESIYGGLFELRCHRKMSNSEITLKARRVYYSSDYQDPDGIFSITFPKPNLVVRYKSNDPTILGEDQYKNMISLDNYFWPTSGNHPSYDSATLICGEAVGVPKREVVALLLQMTVSGATGLPRRPTHVVKQYVRSKFDATFEAVVEAYKADSAITAFVVPPECFDSFQFQYETLKNDDEQITRDQPSYQIVIEMPDIFVVTKEMGDYLSLPDVDSGNNKRRHRYDKSLRSSGKKAKIDNK